ncbi:hypothetical protein GCM10007860_31840 [Chitiniphilus shinanonensis]|uniref:Uncharacterized protein n=2 Tax=Chitiniphilus shinanonensis TaxID=553088 RepID=A0ABQ6BWY1_9NEIS|nr:hypothetical protein GCM10007860_31840 [Chitiniphilus shinanonensis]
MVVASNAWATRCEEGYRLSVPWQIVVFDLLWLPLLLWLGGDFLWRRIRAPRWRWAALGVFFVLWAAAALFWTGLSFFLTRRCVLPG